MKALKVFRRNSLILIEISSVWVTTIVAYVFFILFIIIPQKFECQTFWPSLKFEWASTKSQLLVHESIKCKNFPIHWIMNTKYIPREMDPPNNRKKKNFFFSRFNGSKRKSLKNFHELHVFFFYIKLLTL